MGKFYTEITPELKQFIAEQQMFFTATAAATGRINLSPKGIDTFRYLDEHTVAYLDLTGSGNETAALLAADGRLTIMFCAFAGKPWILRLYGTGEVVQLDSERGRRTASAVWIDPGRAAYHRAACRVGTDFVRDGGAAVRVQRAARSADRLGHEARRRGMKEYRRRKNVTSIDGLPTGLRE